MIESILPRVEEVLEQFKAAEKHAPEELLPIYRTYTAHEQALADFLSAEQNQQDGMPALRQYLGR